MGGAGSDHFVFGLGQDTDTIRDFTPGADYVDLLWIRMIRGINELPIEADGNAAVIDLTTHNAGKIRMESAHPAVLLLYADWFLLPVWQEGNEGNDILIGDGFEPNNIDGHGGDDTIQGGINDDIIVGGPGNDTLTGGCGEDRFIFAAGHGNDTIKDFGDGYYPGRDDNPEGDPGPDGSPGLTGPPGPDGGGLCSPTEDSYRPKDILDLTQLPAISGYDDLAISAEGSAVVVDLIAHGGGTIRLDHFTLEDLRSASIVYYEPPPTAENL